MAEGLGGDTPPDAPGKGVEGGDPCPEGAGFAFVTRSYYWRGCDDDNSATSRQLPARALASLRDNNLERLLALLAAHAQQIVRQAARHERPGANFACQIAFSLQLLEHLHNRHARDAEFARQDPGGRQLGARLNSSVKHQVAQALV